MSNEYWLQKNQTGFHPQCTHVQDGYQLASASCLCTSHMATNFVGMSSDVMFLLLGARFDWTAMLPLTEHGILLSRQKRKLKDSSQPHVVYDTAILSVSGYFKLSQ